jgi:hypothetical protein
MLGCDHIWSEICIGIRRIAVCGFESARKKSVFWGDRLSVYNLRLSILSVLYCLSVCVCLVCLDKKSKHDGLSDFRAVYEPLFRCVCLDSE